MPVLPRIDELSRKSYSTSRADHRRLYDAIHAQLPSDLWQSFIRTFVMHDGGAGDDLDVVDLSEVGDQSIRHAIGEKLLCGITREVFYGKHRQRINALRAGSTEQAFAPMACVEKDEHCDSRC